MVLQSMCDSDIVSQDFASAKDCETEAMSNLFVYSIGFSLWFWGYGYPVLASLDYNDDDDAEAQVRAKPCIKTRRTR